MERIDGARCVCCGNQFATLFKVTPEPEPDRVYIAEKIAVYRSTFCFGAGQDHAVTHRDKILGVLAEQLRERR